MDLSKKDDNPMELKTKKEYSVFSKVLILVFLSLSTFQINIYAEEERLTDKSLYQKLKDSPLSFNADLDLMTSSGVKNEITGERYLVNQATTSLIFYIGYKLSKLDSVRIAPIFEHKMGRGLRGRLAFTETELKYSRKLIDAKSMGFDLFAEARYGYTNRAEDRESNGTRGYYQARATGIKKITDKFTVASQLRYYFFDRLSGANIATTDHSIFRAYLLPSYQFSSKVNAEVAMRYHDQKGLDGSKINSFTLIPNITYQLTKELSLNAYALVKVLESNDKRIFKKEFHQQANYGVTLSAKIF